MGKKRRRFTREFKISVVNELEAGKSLGQLSREHELHPTLITRWRREYKEDPGNAFRGNGDTCKDQSRVAELERLVGQLYAENEFLKKALERLREQNQEVRR